MTHQELGRRLLKYNLCLKLVIWGQNNPRNFNLEPNIKQAVKVNVDSKHKVAGMINKSDKNNFVGMFVPDFMYLIVVDKNYLPKNKASLHKVNINGQSEYVVAQIDPTKRHVYQRDFNYQPHNHQLWRLIKSFVATPIVQRDKDDYICITYHYVSDDHELDGYNVFNDIVNDADIAPRIIHEDYGIEKASDATEFCTHFSLNQIKNYLKKHPLKYKEYSYKHGRDIPVGKIIQVKKIIPAVKKHLEKINYKKKTIPRIKWDFANMINWAFKGHKHQLYIDIGFANKCYQQMTKNTIYHDICDAIADKPYGLKKVYQKLKTKPKHLILSAYQVKRMANNIDDYCEVKGYGDNDDEVWQAQMLDGIRCNLEEYYSNQANK